MINGIFEWLNNILLQNIYMASAASFIWGVLSIMLSPCHLASIPLIIGYINRQGSPSTRTAFYNSLLFAAGILITIAVIGIITSLLGGLIGDIGVTGNYILASVFFVAGLYLLDVIKLNWNSISLNPVRSKGYMMAFVIGLLFGLGLGPCTFAFMAPVLGAVFYYSAASMLTAVLLLGTFALGHCAVIAFAGTMSAKIGKYLNWAENSAIIKTIKRVCGVLVILGGVYFIYTTI